MRRFAALAAGALLAGCSMQADIAAGDKAVAAFHQALNAGQFQKMFADSSQDMKGSTTEAHMVQLYDAIHRKLGTFKDGKTVGFRDNVNTGGHMLGLQYQAHYEKGDAAEDFTFRIDGGRAALAGYHVSSDALLTQ